jgi:uncharacterized membrane protein YcaP (DUF421 family)
MHVSDATFDEDQKNSPPLEQIQIRIPLSPRWYPTHPAGSPSGGVFYWATQNPVEESCSHRTFLGENVSMHALFDMSSPWWHFVLRAIVIYVLVMVLMRLSGKRSVGQFTPFDLVLLILIGNAVQNGLNGGDNSISGAVILAGTLIGLNYFVALMTARHKRFRKVVEGVPVVLARNGELFHDVLRRELVSEADFHEVLRMNDIDALADVRIAWLETNGHISVVSYKSAKDDAPNAHKV